MIFLFISKVNYDFELEDDGFVLVDIEQQAVEYGTVFGLQKLLLGCGKGVFLGEQFERIGHAPVEFFLYEVVARLGGFALFLCRDILFLSRFHFEAEILDVAEESLLGVLQVELGRSCGNTGF